MNPMTVKFAITIPSTVNVNQPNPELHKKMVSYAMTRMAGWFGGVTALPGQGGYVAENGELITESVTVVQSWTDTATAATVNFRELAEHVCREMSQECVGIEYDGHFELVFTKPVRLAA